MSSAFKCKSCEGHCTRHKEAANQDSSCRSLAQPCRLEDRGCSLEDAEGYAQPQLLQYKVIPAVCMQLVNHLAYM